MTLTKKYFIVAGLTIVIILTIFFNLGDIASKKITEYIPPISSQSQTAAVSDFNSSLVAHYTFDDTTNDSAGSNNGTAVGGPTYVDGKIGKAISLDGGDDYVNVGSATSLDNLSTMTVSFWMKPTSMPGHAYVMDKTNCGVGGWGYNMRSFGSSFEFTVDYSTTDLDVRPVPSLIDLNQWQHWTMTWDGSTSASNVHFYKNGSEVSYQVRQDASGTRADDSNRNLLIGSGCAYQFPGAIDDFRIYNRPLTAGEVLELYNDTTGTVTNPPVNVTPPTTEPPPTSPTPYTPQTYQLAITKSGTGTGMVLGTGINCGSDCSETVNSGTSVTLTATSNTGFTFIGWSGGGCSGAGTCIVTVNANTTVNATFNTIPVVTTPPPLTPPATPPVSTTDITYYIDFASGNDTNNGTSASTPWKHAPGDVNATGKAKTTGLIPGTTVLFKGGVVYSGTLVAYWSGTQGKDIIYDGNSDGSWGTGKAILEKAVGGDWRGVEVAADYLQIRNFEIRNYGTGISIESLNYYTFVSKGNHVKILNNKIHDMCIVEPLDHGVSFCGKGIQIRYANDVLVEGNEIYNVNYDAITVADKNSNITIRNNHLHDGENDGIKGGATGTFLIEGNTIHGFPNPVTHGDGIQILGIGDVTIRNNLVYDNGQEIFIEEFTPLEQYAMPYKGEIRVYNNIIGVTNPGANGLGGWNCLGFHLYQNASVRLILVANNVVFNCNGGFGALSIDAKPNTFNGQPQTETLIVQNNIFYNSKVSIPSSSTYSTVGNNLYFNQYRQDYVNGLTLSAFQARYPTVEVNSLYADPKFVSVATLDFHTLLGSPSINAGGSLSQYFTTDKSGTSRPQGSAWDIGAYEYTGSGTTPPPITPPVIPPTYKPGDFNRDGAINALDFSLLSGAWNTNNSAYDLNSDGIVNSLDYVIMVQNWTG